MVSAWNLGQNVGSHIIKLDVFRLKSFRSNLHTLILLEASLQQRQFRRCFTGVVFKSMMGSYHVCFLPRCLIMGSGNYSRLVLGLGPLREGIYQGFDRGKVE